MTEIVHIEAVDSYKNSHGTELPTSSKNGMTGLDERCREASTHIGLLSKSSDFPSPKVATRGDSVLGAYYLETALTVLGEPL